MYHRLAELVERDAERAGQLSRARLLVSGSAPLAAADHERISRCCGQSIVERYGMTETLMISSTVQGATAPGYVGFPLPGVELKVLDDAQTEVPHDDASIGKVLVRSPSLMTGYLGLPEATAAAMPDGYLHTGDVGVIAPDGMLRLVGRESVDLIKSGGYRIGAGEIEATLLGHAAVAEVAVAGLPDPDLGQRIVAWVVLDDGAEVAAEELIQHVAAELTPHKRPREIRYVDALPRNAMGKIQKQRLLHA